MAGAYVAKAAETSSPSVPPGWDLDWPFPGPAPPGYSFDLSFTVTGADSYVPASEYSATNTLYDHDTYETEEPSGSITWTATIDGSEVQLKKSGDSEFASSVTSDYAKIGGYWGAQPTLLFNVGAADDGSVITLQASGDPLTGETITGTKQIEVEAPDEELTLTALFECVITAQPLAEPPWGEATNTYGIILSFHDDRGQTTIPYCWNEMYTQRKAYASQTWTYNAQGHEHPDDFSAHGDVDDSAPYDTIVPNGTVAIEANRLLEEPVGNPDIEYYVQYKNYSTHLSSGQTITIDLTLTLYNDGEVYVTKTKQFTREDGESPDAEYTHWLTINPRTGDVTEVNP